ncbi:MAG TPA: OmpH family outer membrane protein [bacterium]|jgi:outer membrane protein|nr:OmpH family outer membrane protein [bacterium]
MKRFAALVFASALLGLTSAAHAQRIAYVDIKKVFDAYTGTKAAKDALKQKVDDEKAQLEQEKDALDKEASDLEGKKSVLTDEKYQQEAEKLQVKGKALQDKFQAVTNQLQEEEAEQTSQIVDLIKEAVAKVAKRDKYDLVFEASNLLYGGDDITASAIEEVNQQ